MASIFDSLAYENSNIPDSVRRAAQGELDYQKAIRNKTPLANQGSGIPEGVRKAAQAAIERGPSEALKVAAAPVDPWMQGQRVLPEGMFGNAAGAIGKAAGKVLPGVGAGLGVVELADDLNNMYGPAAYENFKSNAEMGRTRRALKDDPELADRGQETVNRITGNAMSGVADYLPQYQQVPQGLTQDELNAQNPNDVPDQPPQQSPMELPPEVDVAQEVGPVAQTNPTTVPEAAAKVLQQQETQRQAIEKGAVKGLSTGAVSRPELAAEIVQADAQKSGVTLTPEQTKKAVAVELTNMKSMDNADVSRYISYALMAAGVLAVAFDKTGQAGENFSNSFNKQLDRNLAAGLQTQKTNAAAAKQAQDLKIALAGLEIKDRQATTQEKAVTQTGEYQQGTLEQRIEAAKSANELGYYREDQANARSAATNNLRQQALDQSQRQFEQTYGLKEGDQQLRREQFDSKQEYDAAVLKDKANRTAIEAAKAAAATKGAKGIDIPTKEAEGLVGAALDSQDLNVSKPAQKAIAQTVRVAAKNNPEAFARDPNGFVLDVVKRQGSPYQQAPAGFFTDPSIEQRKLK